MPLYIPDTDFPKSLMIRFELEVFLFETDDSDGCLVDAEEDTVRLFALVVTAGSFLLVPSSTIEVN